MMTLGQIIDTCHITATCISAPQNMFHLLLHKIFVYAATFNLCAKMSIQSKEVYFCGTETPVAEMLKESQMTFHLLPKHSLGLCFPD